MFDVQMSDVIIGSVLLLVVVFAYAHIICSLRELHRMELAELHSIRTMIAQVCGNVLKSEADLENRIAAIRDLGDHVITEDQKDG